MSLTNLCTCALIKDHKMRQIINELYLLFLRIMNLAYIFLRKNILIYFFKNLRLYPLFHIQVIGTCRETYVLQICKFFWHKCHCHGNESYTFTNGKVRILTDTCMGAFWDKAPNYKTQHPTKIWRHMFIPIFVMLMDILNNNNLYDYI